MIDLTPLDVRKKAGDFRKALRGYDREEVDGFLQLAAERFEELVKENLTLRERAERLEQQVLAHEGREGAVNEALVMAQQLRDELKVQAEREAELTRQEAEALIERRRIEAEQQLGEVRQALAELEKRRLRFLKGFRSLLQRELEAVDVEESRLPHEEAALDIELGGRSRPGDGEVPGAAEPSGATEASPVSEPSGPSAPPADPEASGLSEPPDPSGDAGHTGRPEPSPDSEQEDGLWLSSILKQASGGGGREEPRP